MSFGLQELVQEPHNFGCSGFFFGAAPAPVFYLSDFGSKGPKTCGSGFPALPTYSILDIIYI